MACFSYCPASSLQVDIIVSLYKTPHGICIAVVVEVRVDRSRREFIGAWKVLEVVLCSELYHNRNVKAASSLHPYIHTLQAR